MIPYFQLPSITVGPIVIHPFGLTASLGLIAGVWYSYRVAQREFRGGDTWLEMAPWILLCGFLSAHIVSLVFYFPDFIHEKDFWTFFNVTSGLSSFGGLFGGTLAAYLFIRFHNLALVPWLDVMARGFSLAYVFGRIGCAIVHDHPGLPSHFFLAMDYPARGGFAAVPRHDLGFYELIFWVILFIFFHISGYKQRPVGFYSGLLIVCYTPIRFGLDFLRVGDLTYLGLTFAQWGCICTFPLGVWLLWSAMKHPCYFPQLP